MKFSLTTIVFGIPLLVFLALIGVDALLLDTVHFSKRISVVVNSPPNVSEVWVGTSRTRMEENSKTFPSFVSIANSGLVDDSQQYDIFGANAQIKTKVWIDLERSSSFLLNRPIEKKAIQFVYVILFNDNGTFTVETKDILQDDGSILEMLEFSPSNKTKVPNNKGTTKRGRS